MAHATAASPRPAQLLEQLSIELGDNHATTVAIIDAEAEVWAAFVSRLKVLAGEAD